MPLTPSAGFPRKLECLFQPAPFKVLYGGRGSAKSWGVARALLSQGVAAPLRVLCAREIQNSVKDSVHALLADQIKLLHLDAYYEVQDKIIRCANGTEFIFAGLRHNVDSIKSKEALDRVWVEEAQTVSKRSWDTLLPTVRKPGSEIWVTFNPELDTDDTYKRFVLDPPTGAVVVKMGWQDNPWFGETTLPQQRDDMRRRDYDAYLTIWEGHCRQTLDGAIYAKEIREATTEGRISSVPWNRALPVQTFWDLGYADHTAIWFAQKVGLEYHLIDFYQCRQEAIPHYLKIIADKPYAVDAYYLPHDAAAHEKGSGRSVEEMLRAADKPVQIVARLSVADGINAARTIFPQCRFDEVKCADGLNALRRYRYDVDPETGRFSKQPLHDENSDAADAFRMMAVGYADTVRKPKPASIPAIPRSFGGNGWMG